MIPNVFKDFVQKLLRATVARTIAWVSSDGSTFFCNQREHAIYLYNRFDQDREETYFVFRIETGGKSTPFTVYDYEKADYSEMSVLYEAVIANANNVEADLKDFFS